MTSDIGNLAIVVALGYGALLFLIAFVCDLGAARRLLNSPLTYTLAISVYCTSWTFYGAVGLAARDGLQYATIYLGPALIFFGWWTILRRMLRITRTNNITSIADFLSARFGKSDSIAALVTIITLTGVIPYIALQLKAITTSLSVMMIGDVGVEPDFASTFWIAAGLAVFTIIFGTRNIDVAERHDGVVAAIAVESIVKLVALLAVGILVIYGVASGPADAINRINETIAFQPESFGLRWVALIFLSGAAILCLPRQFHVVMVENRNERHLATAGWLFPLYLLLMSLFILPIAAVGLTSLPVGSDPDMFVLTVPLAAGRDDIALLAFLGGFSSATSMVIVSCIAVSTMVSNHLVAPMLLRSTAKAPLRRDIRSLILRWRRVGIATILLLGFLYLRLGPSDEALAAIGLISFVGVAQMLPALLAALYWPSANRRGVLLGLSAGFALWLYTLLLPGLATDSATWAAIELNGLFGIEALRPHALFGLTSGDEIVDALCWSLSINAVFLGLGSLSRDMTRDERVQSRLFVAPFSSAPTNARRLVERAASADDLYDLAQRVMGPTAAFDLFRQAARRQGSNETFPTIDEAFIGFLERRMASSVGAASARALIARAVGGDQTGLEELVQIADEAAQMKEYSAQIEQKSAQLEATAQKLQNANERLRALDLQKNAFLSQVSHEVRTPMTSIRSFVEILNERDDLTREESKRFLAIIHDESLRLTRLLDEMLDIAAIEQGGGQWKEVTLDPGETLARAIDTCRGLAIAQDVTLREQVTASATTVIADSDRLRQVFINILSNALKYNDNPLQEITINSRIEAGNYIAEIADNGSGVQEEERDRIFEKFQRGEKGSDSVGAGLGLAISRAIVNRFGGELSLVEGSGATFRVTLPIVGTPAD